MKKLNRKIFSISLIITLLLACNNYTNPQKNLKLEKKNKYSITFKNKRIKFVKKTVLKLIKEGKDLENENFNKAIKQAANSGIIKLKKPFWGSNYHIISDGEDQDFYFFEKFESYLNEKDDITQKFIDEQKQILNLVQLSKEFGKRLIAEHNKVLKFGDEIDSIKKELKNSILNGINNMACIEFINKWHLNKSCIEYRKASRGTFENLIKNNLLMTKFQTENLDRYCFDKSFDIESVKDIVTMKEELSEINYIKDTIKKLNLKCIKTPKKIGVNKYLGESSDKSNIGSLLEKTKTKIYKEKIYPMMRRAKKAELLELIKIIMEIGIEEFSYYNFMIGQPYNKNDGCLYFINKDGSPKDIIKRLKSIMTTEDFDWFNKNEELNKFLRKKVGDIVDNYEIKYPNIVYLYNK